MRFRTSYVQEIPWRPARQQEVHQREHMQDQGIECDSDDNQEHHERRIDQDIPSLLQLEHDGCSLEHFCFR